jgi:uncharacterized membrane protein YsdA (DUF1294 family)
MSPYTFYTLVAVIFAGLLSVFFWWLGGETRTPLGILVPYLLAVNPMTFVFYGHDKLMAKHDGRRVPEAVLLGLAFLGGSIGAYAGMRLFRHKSLKGRFRLVFWCVVAVQLLVLGEFIRRALV